VSDPREESGDIPETISVTLKKPIQAHGEERTSIVFRAPLGNDIAACGYPFKFQINTGAEGQVMQPDAQAICGLISRLGNIPRSSVAQLTFLDWHECMGAVLGFFGESIPSMGETRSNGSLISPGSGGGRPETRSD
jgi:Phage tail assembly chaperone proteins, E, or 41 or 14